MSAQQLISQLADSARLAGRTLSVSTGAQRKEALTVIAAAIEARSAEILVANEKDMQAGRASGLNSSLLDRLLLTPERITGIAGGARQVSELEDPLGKTLRKSTLPNGIELEQISVPFGVIGMVYEARPNVTVDAASAHIAKYGTQHTEAILSENKENVKRFIALADCAAVMVNTSTRFTDGEQMGFGAEIGISNQKLHARGPMGLEAMTTTTWIVTGNGQIRS